MLKQTVLHIGVFCIAVSFLVLAHRGSFVHFSTRFDSHRNGSPEKCMSFNVALPCQTFIPFILCCAYIVFDAVKNYKWPQTEIQSVHATRGQFFIIFFAIVVIVSHFFSIHFR